MPNYSIQKPVFTYVYFKINALDEVNLTNNRNLIYTIHTITPGE